MEVLMRHIYWFVAAVYLSLVVSQPVSSSLECFIRDITRNEDIPANLTLTIRVVASLPANGTASDTQSISATVEYRAGEKAADVCEDGEWTKYSSNVTISLCSESADCTPSNVPSTSAGEEIDIKTIGIVFGVLSFVLIVCLVVSIVISVLVFYKFRRQTILKPGDRRFSAHPNEAYGALEYDTPLAVKSTDSKSDGPGLTQHDDTDCLYTTMDTPNDPCSPNSITSPKVSSNPAYILRQPGTVSHRRPISCPFPPRDGTKTAEFDDELEYSYTHTRLGPDGDWKSQSKGESQGTSHDVNTAPPTGNSDDIITNENAAYTLTRQPKHPKPATTEPSTTTPSSLAVPNTKTCPKPTQSRPGSPTNAYTEPPDLKTLTLGKKRVSALAQGFECKIQTGSTETKKDVKTTSSQNIVE